VSSDKAIPVPPATLVRLEQLITQRNTIDGQVDAIVTTLREALDVPGHYIIGDVRRGFVPPADAPEMQSDATV